MFTTVIWPLNGKRAVVMRNNAWEDRDSNPQPSDCHARILRGGGVMIAVCREESDMTKSLRAKQWMV